MADTRTPAQRSKIMRSVRGKDTGPEMIVRRALHRLGYRYSLHVSGLPGRPDLVFPRRQKVIFVHGCYWHGHGCRYGRLPKSKLEFWQPKIAKNIVRDQSAISALRGKGWDVLVIWQCETKDAERFVEGAVSFLESEGKIAGSKRTTKRGP